MHDHCPVIKHFYRWLYHYRQQQAAYRRLHGKPRPRSGFKRFTHRVFQRERFGKYDPAIFRLRWVRWLLATPLALALGWFIWESAHAIGMFQP